MPALACTAGCGCGCRHGEMMAWTLVFPVLRSVPSKDEEDGTSSSHHFIAVRWPEAFASGRGNKVVHKQIPCHA